MISIILPFYNAERYLQTTVQSVLNQTYTDFELLLINDGSTDASGVVATSLASSDSRIKLFNLSHIGFPSVKNFGLDHSFGDYIAFNDADDIVHPQYLQALYELHHLTNCDIACVGYKSFTNERDIEPLLSNYDGFPAFVSYTSDKYVAMLKYPCSTYMWNKLFRRYVFQDLRFPNVPSMSDTILCPDLFNQANQVCVIPQRLYFYRRHNQSMTYVNKTCGGVEYWTYRLTVKLNEMKRILQLSPATQSACRRHMDFIFSEAQPHIDIKPFQRQLDRIILEST